MEDKCFFNIQEPQLSRNVGSSPWMTQNETNVQRQMGNMDTINDRQNVPFPVSSAGNYGASNKQADDIDTWDPMDDDFACPTFNSYKNFDVLNAEHPSEKSPEKSIRQSPEKRVEEISLYVGNIPLSITNEGIRNLFLAVGDVQSCKILPPKDPSYDTKYGFVKFGLWSEAIKAIETYDGFYVGSEKNLQVRVAHRRRGGDDYFAVKDEEYSSSDGTAQNPPMDRHPPSNDYNFDVEASTTDQNVSISDNHPTEVNHSEQHPTEVNNINNDQHLNMPSTQLGNSEQTVSAELPNEASHVAPARERLPCTNCEKLCTQRCSACKAPYCSRECQKIDRAKHKLICTYQSKTSKPVKPSTPEPISTQEPEYVLDDDSDFDCIDISLDITDRPRKEVAKVEIKNSTQSSQRNIVLDSGYTSQKEDMSTAIPNESRCEEINTDTGMEIPHSDIPGAQTWLEKNFLAYVTAVSSVTSFWAVVRTPDYPRFCELTAEMAEIQEDNLEKITAVNIESICLARYSLDNCWYRSKIMQCNTEQVEVIFIDFGNKEWKNIHDLYQLPQGFGDVPPQAHQFILHGVNLESSSGIEQRMTKLLDSMISDKTLQVELVHSAPGCTPEVILRENDSLESINQQMIYYLEEEEKVPKIHMASEVPNDVLPSTQTFDIFVCHFLTPTSFWIWFLDSAKELYKQLAPMLSETYEHSTYSEYLPIVGELIVAKFTDDVWYRAKVDCINNDSTLKVTFVDFGNSEDVSLHDIRKITDALAAFPTLATKCALHGMEKPIRNWSAECIQFCNELMLNKRGSAIVQSEVQDSLVLKVDVEFNGEMKSVVDEIIKKGYLTSENSAVVSAYTSAEQPSMNNAPFHHQPFASDDKNVPPSSEPVLPDSKPVSSFSQPVTASNQLPSYKPEFVHDMKSALPRHQTTLQESKPAFPSNQFPDKHTKTKDNHVSSHIKPATFSNRPGTNLVSPTSQSFPGNHKPVFPEMKPLLSSGKPSLSDKSPVLPMSKPVEFDNQPNRNPVSKPVVSDSSPVLSTNQSSVSPSHKPVLLDSNPEALFKTPIFPGNNIASSVNNSSMQLVSRNVKPSTNKVYSVEIQPNTSPELSSSTINPESVLQSAATNPLSQLSPSSVPTEQKVEERYKTLLPLPSVPNTAFSVIVNDVSSADTFYAQMTSPSLVTELHKCVRRLNEYVTKQYPPKVENAAVGTLGCAKFQDNVWYRAQVVKINEASYKVRFIDFGNVQDVCPDKFLEAPEFFYQLAPQALCCRLGTSDHVWGEQSRSTMEGLTLYKQLLCNVIGGTSWPQYAVELKRIVGDQVVDIAEKLNKDMNHRLPAQTSSFSSNSPSSLPRSPGSASGRRQCSTFSEKILNPAIASSGIEEVGEKYAVKISTVYHPTYFWVQQAENVENIKRLDEELNSYYNNNSYPPFKPLVNSFCVYYNAHQSRWCRGFVRQLTSEGIQVHSVDFGSQSLVDQKYIRPLEEKFFSQPFAAILCSMADLVPCGRKMWTHKAINYFRGKVESKIVTIRVIFNSKSRLFVEVFDPDSNDECLLGTALIANGMAWKYERKSTRSESISCIDQIQHGDVANMPTAKLSPSDDSNIDRQILSQNGQDH